MMGEMFAGALDRRITIQRATVAQDNTGEDVPTWEDLITVWASWRRASARETLASAEVTAAVSDIFEIRWSSDVSDLTPKDRVSYGGKTYDIQEVTEIDRRVGLRIGASARADK